MYKLAQFGLLLLGAAFLICALAGGAGLMVAFNAGGSPHLTLLLLLTLLGLVGTGACLWQSNRMIKAKAVAVAPIAFTGNRLEANVSKPMLVLLFFLTVLMLFPAYLAWLTPTAKSMAFAVLGIVCAGFIGAIFFSYLRSGKPTLVMDAYSLDHAWYGPIRWDQILGMQLREIKGSRGGTQRSLGLGVAKPGRYLQQMPWIMRASVTRKRRDAAVGMLLVPLNPLNQKAELIYAAARELRGRVSPPMLKHWYPDMSAEQIALQRESEATMERLDQLSHSIQAEVDSNAPVSPEQRAEMHRLAAELARQSEAAKPFLERDLAKLKRIKSRTYVFVGLMILWMILRIWVALHKH